MRTILAAAALTGVAALATVPAQAKTITIGLSMLTQDAPYYAALQAAVLKEAKVLGATVVTADANGDMLKQISGVEDMLSQNIDVLIMDPKDAKGVVGVTKDAARAHVLVGQGWGGWTQEGGVKAMEDLLTAHPDINAVLAENDSMALGAMRAIQDAGKADKNILIFAAADGQKEAVKLIEEGKYGATGLNDPAVIGKMAADLALKAVNKQVPADYPKITYTPPVAITKANAAQYYKPDAVF